MFPTFASPFAVKTIYKCAWSTCACNAEYHAKDDRARRAHLCHEHFWSTCGPGERRLYVPA